ncbi:MAG: cell wall-active antibiotics response protein, partial [Actinobacteria bacterium]|nr:cell wall-active antibiotics response protein [Actinomycetota bacterium]
MSDNDARWAVGVFGDSTLDMRGGTAPGDEITVRAVAGFGDVRVMVPPGSRVEVTGMALFGSKRSEVIGDPTATGPVREGEGVGPFRRRQGRLRRLSPGSFQEAVAHVGGKRGWAGGQRPPVGTDEGDLAAGVAGDAPAPLVDQAVMGGTQPQ